MSSISLLIKPVSGTCNIQCRYCFYSGAHSGNPNMKSDTVDAILDAVAASADSEIRIAFQGGEPLLAGVDFYTYFCSRAESRCGQKLLYSIQTNGVLIDEAWLELFEKYRFLVGLSLDGTKLRHDRNRQNTWDSAVKALARMQNRGIPVNALCVVTDDMCSRAEEVYTSLKGLGLNYLQFIPCINPDPAAVNSLPVLLSADRYRGFLCELFDLWYADWDRGNYTSIQLFDDCVHMMCSQRTNSCALCGGCGGYLVIEADGSVYPCDFFVRDEYKLGTIQNSSFEKLKNSPVYTEFTMTHVPPECLGCKWRHLCRGGCPRYRTQDGHHALCSAMKGLLDYSAERMLFVAETERKLLSVLKSMGEFE